jgi:hypothetical protein
MKRGLLARHKAAAFTHSFSIVKRRLYEAVLHSLEAFHVEGSVDAKLRRLLNQVEILDERGLGAEARRMLDSVARLARTHQRQHVLQEVLIWNVGGWNDPGMPVCRRNNCAPWALDRAPSDRGRRRSISFG